MFGEIPIAQFVSAGVVSTNSAGETFPRGAPVFGPMSRRFESRFEPASAAGACPEGPFENSPVF